jgi:hypothetical protein
LADDNIRIPYLRALVTDNREQRIDAAIAEYLQAAEAGTRLRRNAIPTQCRSLQSLHPS